MGIRAYLTQQKRKSMNWKTGYQKIFEEWGEENVGHTEKRLHASEPPWSACI